MITSKVRRKSFRSMMGYRYMRYRDNIRVGHKQFDQGEKKGLFLEAVWLFPRITTLFLPKFTADYSFTPADPQDFQDSGEYWSPGEDIERERRLYQALLKRGI
jgi:hypothetical protein